MVFALILGCKQFTNAEEIEKIEWETFTGVLGKEVVGIWEKYTNKTDVNATEASFTEKCIVSGAGMFFCLTEKKYSILNRRKFIFN